jgi:hypothetical protein
MENPATLLRGEVSTSEGEVPGIETEHENLGSSAGSILKFPSALDEGCVSVPFALTACIPKSAIRKFAAHEPFVVHVNDCGVESLVWYFGERHKSPELKA